MRSIVQIGKPDPRILIIRLGAIGDVVRVLPALHILRDTYPKAWLDWVVEERCASVLDGHPALDELLVFGRPKNVRLAAAEFLQLCQRIRRKTYDVVIDFHGILKSGLLVAASGAPTRVGFAPPRSRELSYLFTNARIPLRSQHLNRVEENLILSRSLAPEASWPNLAVYVPAQVQEEVDAYIEATFDGGKLLVALHVPMPRGEKRWPPEHFAQLADLLLADGRFDVVLTWGPGQFGCVQEVLKRCRRSPHVAPEIPDLKHYAWLVHRADLFFGGDTGPMHIAWVMGTPVVAVFGGTDPAKHAPYRVRHVILCDGWKAEDAARPGRRGARERLRRITPDMAYEACVNVLADRCSNGCLEDDDVSQHGEKDLPRASGGGQ